MLQSHAAVPHYAAHHHLGYATHLVASMLVGGVVFWGLAHVLGCPETRSLLEGLGRRRARGSTAEGLASPEASVTASPISE